MEIAGGFLKPECIGASRDDVRSPAEKSEANGGETVAPLPPRILIVEDEWFIASEIENILREATYDVVGIAATADDAVRLAVAERPDLVLMDIRLSGPRDGIAAAVEINARLGIRSLYVTAHSDPHTRSRGEAAEPLGWISKPIFGDELVAAVRDALQRLI